MIDTNESEMNRVLKDIIEAGRTEIKPREGEIFYIDTQDGPEEVKIINVEERHVYIEYDSNPFNNEILEYTDGEITRRLYRTKRDIEDKYWYNQLCIAIESAKRKSHLNKLKVIEAMLKSEEDYTMSIAEAEWKYGVYFSIEAELCEGAVNWKWQIRWLIRENVGASMDGMSWFGCNGEHPARHSAEKAAVQFLLIMRKSGKEEALNNYRETYK